MSLEKLSAPTAFLALKKKFQLSENGTGNGFQTRNYLPNIYPAYCKIFHPIYEDLSIKDKNITWNQNKGSALDKNHSSHDPINKILEDSELIAGTPSSDAKLNRILWKNLANKLGIPFNVSITHGLFFKGSWPRHLIFPEEGSLERKECNFVMKTLLDHTSEQLCFFYYHPLAYHDETWEGTLFKGSLDDLGEFLTKDGDFGKTPTYWWPDDLSWCVFSEHDSAFTLVAGTRKLIDAFLKHDYLETIEVKIDSMLWGSDE